MEKSSDYIFAHPLKAEFRKRNVKLWMLKNFTGVSESRLSRYLNERDPMPYWLEQDLRKIFDALDTHNIGKSV